MKYISLIVVFLSLLTLSCNQSPQLSKKQVIVNEIDTLEYQIYESGKKLLDDRKPLRLVNAYQSYAQAFSADTISAKYWFKAAQIQVNLGKSFEAISSLDSLLKYFPKNEITPSALQFKAFIYDDRLGKVNKARDVLDELINNFPESELVENAKAYKETLGKSPEEIIVEMEAKAKKAQQESQEK